MVAAGFPILGPSKKFIAVSDNGIHKAQQRTLLPYYLPSTLQEADTVPAFVLSLVCVKPFAKSRCVSIFHEHEGGVTIHNRKDVKIEFLAPAPPPACRRFTEIGYVPKSREIYQKEPGCPFCFFVVL